MKVRDLCVSDVAAVTPETSLARAGALMRKYAVGSLPVIDRNDRVIGMITDRDIALELCRRNAPPSEIFCDEVMSERVATIESRDSVEDALDLMARHRVRRLPVVDSEGVLEGILSIDDIICHAAESRGEDVAYEDVVETLCEIAQEYQAETGETRGAHARRRPVAARRARYREEEPQAEATARPRGAARRTE